MMLQQVPCHALLLHQAITHPRLQIRTQGLMNATTPIQNPFLN
jgi:hypothetical protein